MEKTTINLLIVRLLRQQVFLFLFVFSSSLSAQQQVLTDFPDNDFIHFTTADGLAGNIIRAIAIDKEDFVWIGTNNGLARYDGQRFTPFNALVGHKDLPTTMIHTLFVDSHGILWVRFNNEMAFRIDLQTYKVEELKEDFWQYDQSFVHTCIEDKMGNVWLSVSKGIVKCTYPDKKLTLYPFNPSEEKKVISISKGDDSYFWTLTRKGLYRFDLQTQTFTREQQLIPLDEKTRTICTDEAGNLWFSNWYDDKVGIACYDPQKRQVIRQFNKQQISPTANTDVWHIETLGDKVWFDTNSGGVLVYDTKRNLFKNYRYNPKAPLSIQSDQVFISQKDKEGNIWVGTVNGLHLLRAHRKEVLLLAHNPFDKNSLVFSSATSAYDLDDRRMLLGTQEGLSIYDRIDKSFKNINLPLYNGNQYNNIINTITSGDNGSFWVGTWSGLFQFDKNTGNILTYYITFLNAGQNHPESVKRLDVKAIAKLLRDKKGFLWLINMDKELFRMDEQRQPHVFEKFNPIIPNDKKNYEPACFLEYADRLLIGTQEGIVQYDYTNKTFQLLDIAFPNRESSKTIAYLSVSKTGLLLAIVDGKPFKIDWEKRQAFPIRSLDGQKYWQITEDTEGGIWMNTETGLFRTDINGVSATFFDAKNYLSNNTFQEGYRFQMGKDTEGNLYFGGAKGFSVVNPKEMLYNASAPNVKITSIKYNNQPIDLGEVIHATRSISLPYNQRSFSLEFAALGSMIPQLNQFAYRFDKGDWIDLGNQNTVNFSNLGSGTYVLQVKAANSDGVWNEKGTQLTITIRPPWYNSRLAWLVYIGLIGYGIYYYYQYQRRQANAQAETARLKELDALKTRFYANVSHELRTPLTLMLAPLSTMIKSQTLDNRNFTLASLVRQNAQGLLKLVNEILDLNKLEAGKLALQEEKTVVYNLIRRIVANFESAAEANHIHFSFQYNVDKYLQLMLDADKLQKVLNNLLANAVKFTQAKGSITVTVTDVKNTIQITVADTGRGIHPDDLPHIFNRFYQSNQADAHTEGGTGIGLSLSSELTKLMGGKLRVESTLGHGSTFSFELAKKEVLGTIATEEVEEMNQNVQIIHNPDEGGTEGVALKSILESHGVDASRRTILIVEDNHSLRDYLTLILQTQYNMLTAENGQVALEMLNNRHKAHSSFTIHHTSLPDLILSDVMMPIMDGFQLLSHLKTSDIYCSIPVVMLTARAELQDKLKALRIGVDDYLVKPFEEEELFARIENLLNNARLRHVASDAEALEKDNLDIDTEGSFKTTTKTPTISTVDMSWLAELETSVKINLKDVNYSVERMASDMALSRTQLFRKLKHLTGLSPQYYLQEVRLQHALYLLETQQVDAVKAACYAVGFIKVKHFSQIFQERFGKLPSTYL